MLNICESCSRHSSQTVYELTTQTELCPVCLFDLMNQLAIRHEKKHPKLEPSLRAA